MAHARQELGLRQVGLFGRLFGHLQGFRCRHEHLRAFGNALFQGFIQLAQLIFRLAALRDFAEECAVGDQRLAIHAMQFGEDCDLGAEHGGIHRLVKIIDRAGAISFCVAPAVLPLFLIGASIAFNSF